MGKQQRLSREAFLQRMLDRGEDWEAKQAVKRGVSAAYVGQREETGAATEAVKKGISSAYVGQGQQKRSRKGEISNVCWTEAGDGAATEAVKRVVSADYAGDGELMGKQQWRSRERYAQRMLARGGGEIGQHQRRSRKEYLQRMLDRRTRWGRNRGGQEWGICSECWTGGDGAATGAVTRGVSAAYVGHGDERRQQRSRQERVICSECWKRGSWGSNRCGQDRDICSVCWTGEEIGQQERRSREGYLQRMLDRGTR
ncbi:hypothetical protein DPMN_084222 [Dreissena polymorpha]|uniref:Uncharacterized protein n=1 Tax=Dreissena polymorpha TaxID=45954 RepID=A0A9D3YDF8_DREPO|nr:hypothetical protein DPMN_084222 [Dreissena polymorpha]